MRLLEELNRTDVWLFIFKNNNNPNPDLESAVNELEYIKKFVGDKGWDIIVTKDYARKLLSEGFKPKRVFAKIVIGKKNYPR